MAESLLAVLDGSAAPSVLPWAVAELPAAKAQEAAREAGWRTDLLDLAGVTDKRAFKVPSRSAVGSRQAVDLSSPDGTGTTIPLVVANMTAIAGRRMAETVARRGGLVVIPQDIPIDVVAEVVGWVKERHLVLDTPIALAPSATVADALSLLQKRAHGAGVVVEDGRPVGIVTEHDLTGVDRFTQVWEVMSRDLLLLDADIDPREAFNRLEDAHRKLAPAVDADGRLVGILTRSRRCCGGTPRARPPEGRNESPDQGQKTQRIGHWSAMSASCR